MKPAAVIAAAFLAFAPAAQAGEPEDAAPDALTVELVRAGLHTDDFFTLMNTAFEKQRPQMRQAFSSLSDDEYARFEAILTEELTAEIRRLENDIAAVYAGKLEPEDMRAVIEAFESGKSDGQVYRTRAGKKWRSLRRDHMDEEKRVLEAWEKSAVNGVTLRAFTRLAAEIGAR